MNEDLLQFIWMSGLFNQLSLKTVDGLEVEIYKRGFLNTNAGPDFLNAQIKIDHTTWVGHVEIHTDSSFWNVHKHQLDNAYNNTILHVVLNYNEPSYRKDGSLLPCIELKDRIDTKVIHQYQYLKTNKLWVPCADYLNKIDHFTITQVLDRCLIERLERKTDVIKKWLDIYQNDWHTVFYIALARSFGFGVNNDAFEQLASQLPLPILAKHKNNLTQIEALFFGTSGFLNQNFEDSYSNQLKQEWIFLAKKYHLQALPVEIFKKMRMRPGNLPTIRIAQLSDLVHQSHHLLSQLIEEENVNQIIKKFEVSASEYWKNHYVFDKESKSHNTALTVSAIQGLLINAVVPVLFVYGQMMSNEHLSQKAINILHQLPSENNQIINQWSQFGIHSRTSFDSQALIELKKNNCDLKKCLQCKIGIKMF